MIFLLDKMHYRQVISTAMKTTVYIYLFTIAPALLARMIFIEHRLFESFFLIPLMIFSIVYGLHKFKQAMS